jgi:flagellar basal body-associated protein FliL
LEKEITKEKKTKENKKNHRKMSEPDTTSESNNIVFIIVIGIVFICVIGFIYYRLRKRSLPKQQVLKETPIKAQHLEDPLKNCRVFPTNHGLRIYECNEKGDPMTKISQPVLKTPD